MPSKLKKAIGAVKDRTSISLARVANGTVSGVGASLEIAILKATTHDDDDPIDDRLVSDILSIISSDKSHASACAAAIARRIGRTRNWIVALKSLVLVLKIFQDGDPYFPREVLHAMKRGPKILDLSSFRDDSNSCPWDFTSFVRTFALYLDERLHCFLTGKSQRRYTNRNQTGTRSRLAVKNTEPAVRDMKPVMILDKITYWQRLLDRAIATRPTGAAKSNKLVKASLYAVVQESFDLYRDFSDGLALLLDSFFHLQYQSCVKAFQACVRASKQFEELNLFYDLCKSIGVGRASEYPRIEKISEELIQTLQEFLKDQSSFPANGGKSLSPSDALPPQSRSSRDSTVSSSHDYGDSFDMSGGRYSDYGSYCSTLEDLMNKTDAEGTSPPMSCYSEPYGGIREDPGNSFDTFSTKSLPNVPSVSDLMTVDLDLLEDVNSGTEAIQQEWHDPKAEPNDPWEALMSRGEHSKNPASIPQEPSPLDDQKDPGNWLLALEETATAAQADNTMALVPFGLDQTTPAIQMDSDQYNPFLEDPSGSNPFPMGPTPTPPENVTGEARPRLFQTESEPTFRANVPEDFEWSFTPTFRAVEEEASLGKCDPFGTGESFGIFGEAFVGNGKVVDQQTVLEEQQLWLQNQSRIMSKHFN
ncbi:PREDICTED: clathrin coat assembly protein AP180-like [Tarenaya hassleriana]|uniref:clathrin coat assembly protein AP180-like n=1 Tax=Tarenaya hassleriana TaxID=28532 RepID=UPI00053C46AA|nr:PREDICTED: clathrin coat assembly protein AP180-like [Tarenaya hassleriana]